MNLRRVKTKGRQLLFLSLLLTFIMLVIVACVALSKQWPAITALLALVTALCFYIAKLRRAEETVRNSESNYRELVENANSIIIKWDCDGRITFCNRFAEQFFGYSHEELVGRPLVGTIVPETETGGRDLAQLIADIDRNPDAYINSVNENIRSNGERVWVSWNNHPLVDSHGRRRGTLSIGQDITERVRLENELRNSEEKFAIAFRATPDAICLTRLVDGVFLEVNEGFESMSGYASDDVINTSSLQIGFWVEPPERDKLVRQVREQGMVRSMEVQLRRKDGSIILGQISARIIEVDGTQCLLSIIRDVTERDFIQRELVKAQKLESIGILAGGIAHNFNNVLTGVVGYISYARKHVENPAKIGPILESAEKAAFRAAGLARQLLTFSRSGDPVRKPFSIEKLVNESVTLFLSGTAVKGVVECATDQAVFVDREQINQAFNNIVLNAIHSMPDGGTLTARIDPLSVKDGNVYLLKPGAYVRVVFADTGCGIDREHLDRVFDPYFTTKEGGTGLGLSTTHSIIRRHGGHIDVTSLAGSGTTVTLILPASDEKPLDEGIVPVFAPPRVFGSVLVMDDERMIRNMAAEMLVDVGWEVHTCADGTEAIALYRAFLESGKRFSVVITDLVIPGGVGGVEVARQILEVDPQARLLASSGYSDDPVMAEHEKYGFCGTIGKPYNVEALRLAVMKAVE